MSQPRFIKIDAQGQQLPADAPAWVAVLDTTTGLMWSAEESPEMTQPECAKYAQGLKVAGFTDWALPTRAQLLTLVDDTKCNPAIDTAFFPGCKSDWYWTQTPDAVSPGDYAWLVYFGYGVSGGLNRNHGGFVRAVRVGQSLAVGPLTEQGAA